MQDFVYFYGVNQQHLFNYKFVKLQPVNKIELSILHIIHAIQSPRFFMVVLFI